MRKTAIALIVIVFLAAFGVAVFQKEDQLANGQRVVLRLAPVDPFSLIQGHYMILDFDLVNAIENGFGPYWERETPVTKGAAVIVLDENDVATFVRIYDGSPLDEGELLLRYNVRNGYVRLASGAFFFQENHADYYNMAEYAELRLNGSGSPLIANLLNNDFVPISHLAAQN